MIILPLPKPGRKIYIMLPFASISRMGLTMSGINPFCAHTGESITQTIDTENNKTYIRGYIVQRM
jgi:hypothetical protein